MCYVKKTGLPLEAIILLTTYKKVTFLFWKMQAPQENQKQNNWDEILDVLQLTSVEDGNCVTGFKSLLPHWKKLHYSEWTKVQIQIKILMVIWLLMRLNAPIIWQFWDHSCGLELSLGVRAPSYLKTHYHNRVRSFDDKESRLND